MDGRDASTWEPEAMRSDMSSRKPEVAEAALGVKAARAAGRATAARGATEVPAMELLRSGAALRIPSYACPQSAYEQHSRRAVSEA